MYYIMKYINLYAFLISLIIGLLFTYVSIPSFKSIIVYPTKDNQHLFQFTDKTNNCFNLIQKQASCSHTAKEIPLQI